MNEGKVRVAVYIRVGSSSNPQKISQQRSIQQLMRDNLAIFNKYSITSTSVTMIRPQELMKPQKPIRNREDKKIRQNYLLINDPLHHMGFKKGE